MVKTFDLLIGEALDDLVLFLGGAATLPVWRGSAVSGNVRNRLRVAIDDAVAVMLDQNVEADDERLRQLVRNVLAEGTTPAAELPGTSPAMSLAEEAQTYGDPVNYHPILCDLLGLHIDTPYSTVMYRAIAHIRRTLGHPVDAAELDRCAYEDHRWSDTMREAVERIRIAVDEDGSITDVAEGVEKVVTLYGRLLADWRTLAAVLKCPEGVDVVGAARHRAGLVERLREQLGEEFQSPNIGEESILIEAEAQLVSRGAIVHELDQTSRRLTEARTQIDNLAADRDALRTFRREIARALDVLRSVPEAASDDLLANVRAQQAAIEALRDALAIPLSTARLAVLRAAEAHLRELNEARTIAGALPGADLGPVVANLVAKANGATS